MTPVAVILSTWATLDGVRGAVLGGKLGAVMSASSVLAAVCAGIALLSVSSDYISGQGMSAWQLVKPLALLLLVCQFNTMVLTPLNGLVNIFTRDLAAAADISTKEYTEQWASNTAMITAMNYDGNKESFADSIEEIAQSDSSGAGKFFAKIWTAIRKVVSDIFTTATFTVAGLVGAVLFLIVKIVLFAQQVLCSLYLTVASLLGPLVFALAIIPGFSSGIRSWIARYIQIAMWVPIGYFMLYMNLVVSNTFCSQAAADGASLSMEWFMIALQTVALVSIAAVPKLAAMVVESTGANDAHGTISQPAKNIARTIIKL